MGPGHQKSRRWVVDVSLCASCPVGMSDRYNRGRRAGGRGQNLYPLFRFQKIEEGPSCWSSVLLFDLPKRSGKYMHFYSVCAICAHQYGLVCCLSVLKGGSSVFLFFFSGSNVCTFCACVYTYMVSCVAVLGCRLNTMGECRRARMRPGCSDLRHRRPFSNSGPCNPRWAASVLVCCARWPFSVVSSN